MAVVGCLLVKFVATLQLSTIQDMSSKKICEREETGILWSDKYLCNCRTTAEPLIYSLESSQ